MERIIQIKESEYNNLFDRANLTNEQIEEKAQELYKKKGVFKLDLCYNNEFVQIRANERNWGSCFKFTKEESQSIMELVREEATAHLNSIYRVRIDRLKSLENKEKDFNSTRKVFHTVTILGWLTSIVLCVVAVMK